MSCCELVLAIESRFISLYFWRIPQILRNRFRLFPHRLSVPVTRLAPPGGSPSCIFPKPPGRILAALARATQLLHVLQRLPSPGWFPRQMHLPRDTAPCSPRFYFPGFLSAQEQSCALRQLRVHLPHFQRFFPLAAESLSAERLKRMPRSHPGAARFQEPEH